MKTQHLLSLLLALTASTLTAQWNDMNTGVFQDLYSVDYFSENDIWIGSYNQVAISADGGAGWTIVNPIQNDQNVLIYPANIYDLALTSPTEALATGLFYTGNSEHILRTTNGGFNWNAMTANFTVGLPRYLRAVDVSGNRAVAVGNNGRIAYSSDSGQNWAFVPSGMTGLIYDVRFISYDTVFAAGDGGLLRSVNGGATWTKLAPSGPFYSLASHQDVVYVVDDVQLLKSLDRGNTFSPIDLPFYSPGVLFAPDKDVLLCANANGMYYSKTGGMNWERFVLPGYRAIKMIDFLDANRGVAVGIQGYSLKTEKLTAAPSIPVSAFTPQGGLANFYCIGDSLVLLNQSPPGYNYTWRKNGVVFSHDYNSGTVLQEAGTYTTLELIVSNTWGADTSSLEFYVDGHPFVDPFSFTASADTVCDGKTVNISLPVSQLNAAYQLYVGAQPVGSLKYGNGGPLTFTTPPVAGTANYTILATRNSLCFTDSLAQSFTIYSATAPANAPFSLSQDTACYYDLAHLELPNSLPGYRYTWHSYTTGLSGTNYIDGTGSAISIPLPALSASHILAPRAVSVDKGCITNLNSGKLLTVEKPQPYFTLNHFNPELGEPVYIINNSENPVGNYQWDFGAGASPQFSTLADPGTIVYNTTGQKMVKLINITPYGCTDSATHVVNILDPLVSDDCRFILGASTGGTGTPLAMAHDRQDNLLCWYQGGSAPKYVTYSNHGDSIVSLPATTPGFQHSGFLTKYNPKGIPMWTARLSNGSTFIAGDVEADSAGNIFCAYYHPDYLDSLRIYATDGRYVALDPPHNGYIRSIVVVKFDKNGILQWYDTFLAGTLLERIALKTDQFGNLYVCSSSFLQKYDGAGQLLWSRPGTFSDIAIDQAGLIWVSSNSAWNRDITVQQYDPAGNLLFSSPGVDRMDAVIATNFMKLDALGNIYLAGVFRNSFVYGNDTISDPDIGTMAHEDIFLCKMKPNGQQEWIKQFRTDINSALKGIEVRGNHILLLATNYGDTVFVDNLPPMLFPTTGHFLYHTDSLGGSESLVKLYQAQLPTIAWSAAGQLISFRQNSDALALEFEFNSDFAFGGAPVSPYSTQKFAHNFFIGTGTLDCMLPDIPAPSTPYSYFLPSANRTCTEIDIQLTDVSSNNPSVWLWSIPGGTPASSTEQNPVVTFSAPGIYTITLTASNASGIGTTFSKSIVVDPLPLVVVTGDSVVCVGTEALWFRADSDSPDLSFQWQDSTAAHTWLNIDGQTSPELFLFNLEQSQNGQKYRCIVSSLCTTISSRVVTLTVHPLPAVSSIPYIALCNNTPEFPLALGSPAGGKYSGPGMQNDYIFSAAYTPIGVSNEISYTYTDANGCSNQDTTILFVENCYPENCPNTALDFNGNGEHLDLPVINGFPANTNFTLEGWINLSAWTSGDPCIPNFRHLFSLSGPNTRIELGQCGGQLVVFWRDATDHGPFIIDVPSMYDGEWRHVALTRNSNVLRIYLDGSLVYTAFNVGTLDVKTFRVGHWENGDPTFANWIGIVDDVRLWAEARSSAQINLDRKGCLPTGTEANLVVYWPLDDGMPSMDNSAISQVQDLSLQGNHGMLLNFELMQYFSNFICSAAPLLYADFQYPQVTTCGVPVFFANQALAIPGNNFSYLWDFGDGTTSQEAMPVHVFDVCSTQDVCLTVSAAGCDVTYCQTVLDSPPMLYCTENVWTTTDEPSCSVSVQGLQLLVAQDNCAVQSVDYSISGATTGVGTDDASGFTFNSGNSTLQYTATDSCGNTATCSLQVQVECLVTATNTAWSAYPLKVFPNPNTGVFTVVLPKTATTDMLFRITDLAGRLQMETITNTGTMQQAIEAGNLPDGLYFLQVISEGKVLAVEKFVKQ